MNANRIKRPSLVVIVAAIGLLGVLAAVSGPMRDREAAQIMPRKVYRLPAFPTDQAYYLERLVFSCHSTLPQPGSSNQSARCTIRVGDGEFPVVVRSGETFVLELGSGVNDSGHLLSGTTGSIECPEGPWLIDVYGVSVYSLTNGAGGSRGTLIEFEQIE
jgi:hypothetical protein